ncbi:hypothetical protein GCM10007079_22810 [Nocardiopsis terrae]|nr:hypothetical protein GCM10007079_22810 [Nocardiopsis terrae]
MFGAGQTQPGESVLVGAGACVGAPARAPGDQYPVHGLGDGPILPTARASRVWVLGSRLRVRLNLVRPPEATWVGRDRSNARQSAHRVDCAAAASRSGAFALARTRARVRLLVTNSSTGRPALAWLQGTHASTRFDTRSDPPRERGYTWSMFNGTFTVPQYTQARSNLASRYSRTSNPARVPCWYSTPSNGFPADRAWVSKATRSTCTALTGAHRHSRSTHERVVSTRCRSEGANHPRGRVRLENRGVRWRRFALRRRRR